MLWRDASGWCLLYKRLDENVVALPTRIPDGATAVAVDAAALARLLDGVKPQKLETEREVAKKSRALALSVIDAVPTKTAPCTTTSSTKTRG